VVYRGVSMAQCDSTAAEVDQRVKGVRNRPGGREWPRLPAVERFSFSWTAIGSCGVIQSFQRWGLAKSPENQEPVKVYEKSGPGDKKASSYKAGPPVVKIG
jgi:hypothetical protein